MAYKKKYSSSGYDYLGYGSTRERRRRRLANIVAAEIRKVRELSRGD